MFDHVVQLPAGHPLNHLDRGGDGQGTGAAAPRSRARPGHAGGCSRDSRSLPPPCSVLRFATLWLAALIPALFLGTAAAEDVYTVKGGDTLWGIARKFGVSVAQLAERNAVSRNYFVRTGQRLVIPSPAGTAGPPLLPPRALPAAVQRAIARAKVTPGRWEYLVIHHSGVDCGTLKGTDRYHREERHMKNGMGYHFLIGNGNGMADGEIGVGSRWTRQLDGGHLISQAQNAISLGICLVGNFEKHPPTPRQMQSLTALVQALLSRCNLSPDAVRTHQQINVVHTRCPGRYFPIESFRASLKPKP